MIHQTFVSVVVYVRNEQQYLERFLRELGAWLGLRFALYEIVVVDDASTDATAAAAHAAAAEVAGPVAVLELARRHGVEAAMLAGLDRSMGDFVFELESSHLDFSLEVLERLYLAAAAGFDVVAAAGDAGSRRSRMFYRVVNRYSNLDVELTTERVRIVSRRALNAMLSLKEKVRYRKALYGLTGYRQTRLVYEPLPQAAGRPRPNDRETASLAFDILLSFSGFGLQVAHRLALVFLAFSVVVMLYAAAIFFLVNDVVEGWTTVVVVVSVGFAGLFAVLGIIAEYAARILIEVRGRPVYSLRAAQLYPADTQAREASRPPAELLARQAATPLDMGRADPSPPGSSSSVGIG